MRADRLLSLLLLLQNRGRMTAPELAAELGVSVRTVYRDVEALGASGVPVYADRGPVGGYRLMDGYRTRLTGLTSDEAGSLHFAGMPAAAAELGLAADLTTAQLKLGAALPDGLGERTRRVQERFHLDAPAWFRDADPAPYLAEVAGAVWRQRLLRVHYRSWRGDVHRQLGPLGVVLKGGNWYLVADAGESVRTYRVSRMLAAEALEEGFERPAGFDLAAYWQESARRMEAGVLRGEARLRVSPRGLRLLPVQFGAAGSEAVRAAGPPDEEGWVETVLRVEALPVALGDLLRLGLEAEVLGPPELRAEVARTVTGLAQRYQDGAAARPSLSRIVSGGV
ncbi:YafY family protein [Streptomyces sp. ISL-100]|uniref:helix-turn-helix transcriptional regulator n=1 Tax=Streptomyces sp. ISL-100 TaxID=2819173 RepID=UPI001BEC8C63|nr:transcriptional regulator [Streptomyces sp. ISL-100]MBT2396345.1 WYL domain-containing protein [Streptomyces sp. ISL-100]